MTLNDLDRQVERMCCADTPKAGYNPQAYANSLNLALQDMPNMSAKTIGLLMEALHSAYQLGQCRQNMLNEQERERRGM